MANHVGLIMSCLFLSIYIFYSYEIISYQKVLNESLCNTNNIAYVIQENGFDQQIIDDDTYFYYIDVKTNEYTLTVFTMSLLLK